VISDSSMRPMTYRNPFFAFCITSSFANSSLHHSESSYFPDHTRIALWLAHAVPGDAAKAARGFEDEVMVRGPAHQMALAFQSAMGRHMSSA
jgi:hypothetical protein